MAFTRLLVEVNGFKEPIDLKNAKDVAIFDDALRKANAVVPHVTCF